MCRGGDNLGCDDTFPWSRVLTHPLRCKRMRHRVIRGHSCHRGRIAAIIYSMPLFGFGFHDVIGAKQTRILLV